ncbi:MAG: AI-2E family transporter [Candidatus Microsaccharimonas sp.]
MKTHPLTSKNWWYVAIVAVVLGIMFAWPFLSVVALAALMAFLFNGVYQRLLRHMRGGAAATLTFLWSIILVVVPIILILIFTFVQLTHLASDLTATYSAENASIPQVLQDFINWVNTVIAPVVGAETIITGEGALTFLKSVVPDVINNLIGFVSSFLGGIPVAIALTVMYIFLFYEALVYGKKIIATVVALSPFQPDITRMFLARVGLMANAMAKGQLLISFIISLLSSLILTFCLGLGDYFFLMLVAFTALNLVPLGCGIIVIPITFAAMLFGNFAGGITAFLLYLVAANLDDFIRPHIIPKSITLTPGLTALSAFGGIALFGLIGVVYGPIIMIIIVTSIQMYLDYYDKQPKWRKKANASGV